MKDSIIVGLLQNTATLLALSYIYEFWWNRNDEPKNNLNKIITGLVIGLIGIVLMLTPLILIPGLMFDTRSVALSVSGLFFGKLPTTIAIIITLLDINMPVMSGFEVLAEMKKESLNTKIIAQTAYAMPEEKERCLSAGCHGYISKPIRKDDLFTVINSVLSI